MQKEKIIISIVNNSPQTRRAVILGGKAVPAPDSDPTRYFRFDVSPILVGYVNPLLLVVKNDDGTESLYQTDPPSSPIFYTEQILFLINSLDKGLFFQDGDTLYVYSSKYNYKSIVY